MNLSDDTIAAPITSAGHAAVSVVRVSGAAVGKLIAQLFSEADKIQKNPRKQVFSSVLDLQKNNDVLDHGLACFFPGPNSFTGEDVLEVALHGSPYLVQRLLSNLSALGVRHAQAGEFTQRAFLNGKIDLSQAEAVADIINAETEIQAKIAREQLEGKLSQAISDLGEPLRNLLAEIEAYIDFPDEDISPITQEQWLDVLSKIAKKVEAYISSYQQGKICREGALVVLAGVPNAGKSSLLNRLLGEDRAIVTSIAGTTRDSLEEVASINGLRIRFCDTAGLAEEGAGRELDEVEKLGIARSWKKLENSDLTLFILDASTDFKMQEAALLNVRPTAKKLLVVANKSDLITENTKGDLLAKLKGDEVIFISAKSGDAIEELQSKIFTSVIDSNRDSSSILICSERHLEALKTTFLMLQETKVAIESKVPSEFVSANLRSALTALNDIIGVTHTEDILGRIFSKFCIGK